MPVRPGGGSLHDPDAWIPPCQRVELVPEEGLTARGAVREACGQEPTTQQVDNARKRLAIAVEVGRLVYERGREAGRYNATRSS